MRILFPSLACAALACAVVAMPAAAWPVAPQDTHDALAARLVAVLPPASKAPPKRDAFLDTRAAELTARYPAKSAQIAAGFADRTRCSDGKREEIIGRMMLAVATSLSDDDLRGMIAFYTGPDHAASQNVKEGSADWAALAARYPLVRFGEAMQAKMRESLFEEVFAAEEACDAAMAEAFAKEGISE